MLDIHILNIKHLLNVKMKNIQKGENTFQFEKTF